MRLEVPGEGLRVTVGDTVAEGTLPVLDAKKRNIAPNPAKREVSWEISAPGRLW